jgi:hypothetical protein
MARVSNMHTLEAFQEGTRRAGSPRRSSVLFDRNGVSYLCSQPTPSRDPSYCGIPIFDKAFVGAK